MLWTKFKYENEQRAITQNLGKQELWFMCTALPLDETYPPTKFHNHSFYSLGDMHQTKFKYEKKKTNKQRAITQRLRKQELQFMCTALPLDEIYPPTKFHNHSNYILEICTGQKSSLKVNKGQSLKKKKQNKLWFMCTVYKKEKLLIMSNFSFSHNVFYSSR